MLADRAFPICVLRSVTIPAIVRRRTDDNTNDGSALRGLRAFNDDGGGDGIRILPVGRTDGNGDRQSSGDDTTTCTPRVGVLKATGGAKAEHALINEEGGAQIVINAIGATATQYDLVFLVMAANYLFTADCSALVGEVVSWLWIQGML